MALDIFELPMVRGKMRPRFGVHGGHAVVYKDRGDERWEQAIRAAYVKAGGRMHGDEVAVEIMVRRALPKSRRHSDPDTHKPDVDNIGKSVMDALNGTAYDDDRQVTRLLVDKAWRFGTGDRMVVIVRDVDEGIKGSREDLWQRFTRSPDGSGT